ncbi:MAG: xanthine dehydrogenase family protein molybdopterin-binding subunit [Planctomycetota bacterium]|jgi:xanthine dehydrogenase YagR molybdenum-binding subunit|nr:xanthine dehydrogenase family protein molybdopterin-binding subunit [Planctomycetota bacterium]MDP6990247.1 xanthine dehydrogenase family protein molybdopterin-binding subunit [Planctomycetota bacterium]
MASPRRDGPVWKPRAENQLLAHDLPRVDGPLKVSGRARYSHDVRLPGMLYGRLVCCPVPCAEVAVDLAGALKLPGVEAAVVVHEGTTRTVGQVVAAVAARTVEEAEDGARAVRLSIEELPWAVDREQALAPQAPAVTRRGNRRERGEDGDAEAVARALAESHAVVEATYSLPVQHHVCLETHGCVCDYRGGDEATIYASTQATFGIARDAARVLDIPARNVRTIVHHMGGGFGSKFSLDIHGRVACMLSKECSRPVHLLVDRSTEFHTGGNRSGSRQHLRGGVSAEGELTALEAEAEMFGGVGGGAVARMPYIYSVGRVHARRASVHTHTDSSRAMRAPGHPQASFAMESLVDELATAGGFDQVEFRKRNLADPVYHRQLDRVALEIGWPGHPHRSAPGDAEGIEAVGIGFGVSVWGGGGSADACECEVRIERDGGVTSSMGSQDLGTGVRTYLAAIVAEELGLELSAVEARLGDNRLPKANASGGSVTTGSAAPAIKDAAHEARVAFAEHLAEVLGVDTGSVTFDGGVVRAGKETLSWSAACETLPDEGLRARGVWREHLQASGVHGAQAARVRVDLETGRVRVEKMVCVQDQGLPLNRLALRSQINGGMIQALSYALLEERLIDPDLGLLLSDNLEDYKIAGSLEIPELVAIIDDDDERAAPIGMAEAVVIPGAAAIANAIHNACGVRLRHLPLTPTKVLEGLAARARGEEVR